MWYHELVIRHFENQMRKCAFTIKWALKFIKTLYDEGELTHGEAEKLEKYVEQFTKS